MLPPPPVVHGRERVVVGTLTWAEENKQNFLFVEQATIVVLPLKLILFVIWTNTFYNLDKYSLQFRQVHLAI